MVWRGGVCGGVAWWCDVVCGGVVWYALLWHGVMW